MPKTTQSRATSTPKPASKSHEQVHLLALDQIREDPDQPRRTFKEASLRALADNIQATAGRSRRPWVDGLLHPIVVVPEPGWEEGAEGPRYRLLVGARRLRSYRLRGWPKIPARLLPGTEGTARTLLIQLNENLGREDTSLWEDAQAVARAYAAWKTEHPKGTGVQFAKECGRSKTWLSRHLAVARAKGLPRKALSDNRLGHGEAYRLFCLLPSPIQRRLLREAEKKDQTITAAMVRAAMPLEAEKAPPVKAAASRPAKSGSAKGGNEPKGSPPAKAPRPRQRSIPIVLTPAEVRRLLEALGHPSPTQDRALEDAFRKALAAL